VKVSAPEYVDYLMTWVQNQLDDESVFPSKVGVAFPKNFKEGVKKIFKRLFRGLFFKKITITINNHHSNTNTKIITHYSFFSLCTYLSFSFPKNCIVGRGSTSKYFFQTFHLFRSRI